MHIGETPGREVSYGLRGGGMYVQIRFWNVMSRIFRGEKRVGGLGSNAAPVGGSSMFTDSALSF